MDIQQQIQRESDEPAYAQLAQIIKLQISKGMYRSGDRLPSESQLRKKYKVSPMTVRRAINILVEKNVVWTSQGLGTFVSSLKMNKVTFGLDDMYQVLNTNGTTQVKVLRASIVKADETIAELLDTPVGSNTIHICRLLVKDNTPLIYHREFLIYDPRRPIIETELQVASLLDLFSGSDESELKSGNFTISVVSLAEEDASALDCKTGDPAFHLSHTFYDYNEKPISSGVFVCRGDKFSFTASIGQGMGMSTLHKPGGER